MQKQLTRGPVMPTMLRFAVPMILGDLLQQCYNIADTWIVGRFLGSSPLAAVGSSFTLMTFIERHLLKEVLCMRYYLKCRLKMKLFVYPEITMLK